MWLGEVGGDGEGDHGGVGVGEGVVLDEAEGGVKGDGVAEVGDGEVEEGCLDVGHDDVYLR